MTEVLKGSEVCVHSATLAELRDGDSLLIGTPSPFNDADCDEIGRRLRRYLEIEHLAVAGCRSEVPFAMIFRKDKS